MEIFPVASIPIGIGHAKSALGMPPFRLGAFNFAFKKSAQGLVPENGISPLVAFWREKLAMGRWRVEVISKSTRKWMVISFRVIAALSKCSHMS